MNACGQTLARFAVALALGKADSRYQVEQKRVGYEYLHRLALL